jgi:N-methylhydantoinase A
VLRAAAAELEAEAERWLRQEHGYDGPAVKTLSAEMRYRGQSHEIEVGLDAAWLAKDAHAAIAAAVHERHRALYDFHDPAAVIQVVNLRLVIAGMTERPSMAPVPLARSEARPERQVEVWLDGARHVVPLYLRSALGHGNTIAGPAIVVQEDTTVCIPGGFAGAVDAHLNLVLSAEA